MAYRQEKAGFLALWVGIALLAASCGGDSDEGLPAGLDCAEVASSVGSYEEAVAYFEAEGRPARLDPDGNGVPCEQDFAPREVAALAGTSTTGTESTTTTGATTTTALGDTTTTGADESTTTAAETTTTEAATTTTAAASVPTGQFESSVGGTQLRVCQRWFDEIDPESEDPIVYFGPLRERPTVEVGSIAVFCAFNVDFDFDIPIQVVVTHPDGSQFTFAVQLDSLDQPNTAADPLAGQDLIGDGDVEGVQWVVRSGHPLGTYEFVATQDDLVLESSVQIVPATAARIEPFHENRGGFPGPLGFAFSGFAPGQDIALAVYKDITNPNFDDERADHEFELVKTLQSTKADGGGAVIVFVAEGDLAGVDPPIISGNRHCLATTLDLIPKPVCDNFRGGWFSP